MNGVIVHSKVLMSFAGAHITALYLWQITILRAGFVQGPATWLGLYRLTSANPLYDLVPQARPACSSGCRCMPALGMPCPYSSSQFIPLTESLCGPQVIHLVALHILFAALGFYAAGTCPSDLRHDHNSRATEWRLGSTLVQDDNAAVLQPLISSPRLGSIQQRRGESKPFCSRERSIPAPHCWFGCTDLLLMLLLLRRMWHHSRHL